MSLTVREALKLDVLRDIRVVAGHDGLERKITWVSILEVLDDIGWLHEGELLVTTAFGLMEDPDLQNELIPELDKRGLAGLAIQTGYYVNEIPEIFFRQADQYSFPLLLLPKELAFSDLTRALLRLIVARQVELLEYTERIHKEFTQVILDNRGLPAVATVLAQLLNLPVRILDKSHEVLAEADAGSVLQSWPMETPQLTLCHLGTTVTTPTQVIAPILAGKKMYGYISVLKNSNEVSELDIIAISRASTVCALELLKERAIFEAETRIRGDFLDDLLSGNFPSKEAIARRARALGYNLETKFMVMVINLDFFRASIQERTEEQVQFVKQTLFDVVSRIITRKGYQSTMKVKGDDLVLLLQISDTGTIASVRDLVDYLRLEIRTALKHLTASIGIGRLYSDLADIPESYQQAINTLSVAKGVWKQDFSAFYDDLGIYRILISTPSSELKLFYNETVAPLIEKDLKNQGELVKTAEIYLRCNTNIKDSAAELFIHRHTLRYRMHKVEAITGLDLSNADDRLRLQLGLMIRHVIAK